MVNARNRMGGYVGRTRFAVVIDHGIVRAADTAGLQPGMVITALNGVALHLASQRISALINCARVLADCD